MLSVVEASALRPFDFAQGDISVGKAVTPPAITAPRWLAKEGIKQNALILRPLLLTSEEIRSYLGSSFFADKEMNKYFEPQHLQGGLSGFAIHLQNAELCRMSC